MKAAFIDLGNMGAAMARCILRANHDLTVWNRTAAKMQTLIDEGAKGAANRQRSRGGGRYCRDESASLSIRPSLQIRSGQQNHECGVFPQTFAQRDAKTIFAGKSLSCAPEAARIFRRTHKSPLSALDRGRNVQVDRKLHTVCCLVDRKPRSPSPNISAAFRMEWPPRIFSVAATT